jgi:hypothetical protein
MNEELEELKLTISAIKTLLGCTSDLEISAKSMDINARMDKAIQQGNAIDAVMDQQTARRHELMNKLRTF